MNFLPFFKEIWMGKSVSRALQFSFLSTFFKSSEFDRAIEVLELGSQPSSHMRTYPKSWTVRSSNISSIKGIELDYILDANQSLPFEGKTFDGVIAMGVFYTLEDPMFTITECLRVSKYFLLFSVPHISAIARDPLDLHRYTEDGIRSIIKKISNSTSCNIVPIGGTFTSALSLVEPFLRFRVIKVFLGSMAFFLDKLDKITGRSVPIFYLVLIKS